MPLNKVSEGEERGAGGKARRRAGDGSPVKVCIIDDHSVVRMGLKYMMSYIDDVECVGEASGGEGAAAFVRGCGADVTLLDVRMPGVDGIAALDEILSDNPDAKVIMLSTSDAEEDIFRAVTMGAKGYLLKESDPNRLLEAIRAVAAGGTCLPAPRRRTDRPPTRGKAACIPSRRTARRP